MGGTRWPGYLRTSQSGELVSAPTAIPWYDLMIAQGLERNSAIAEPGARFAFELSRQQGAALVIKYATYREDIER